MSPVDTLYVKHSITNHQPQDPPSFHGFWSYFGLVFFTGIVSAVMLYSLYSCYHSAAAKELTRIRESSVEADSESKGRTEQGAGVDYRNKPVRGRSSGVWLSNISRNRFESAIQAKVLSFAGALHLKSRSDFLQSPFLRQSTSSSSESSQTRLSSDFESTGHHSLSASYYTVQSSYSQATGTLSTLSPPPMAYDPTRDLKYSTNTDSTSPTTQLFYGLSHCAHPPSLRPGIGRKATILDRNSIPFIASEQLAQARHLIDPKLAPIRGSFSLSLFASSEDSSFSGRGLMIHGIGIENGIELTPPDSHPRCKNNTSTSTKVLKPLKTLKLLGFKNENICSKSSKMNEKAPKKRVSPTQRRPLAPINIKLLDGSTDSTNLAFGKTMDPLIDYQGGIGKLDISTPRY
ncbi:hypothetical protein L218DRAFT_986033 [Marasmius fiardii PR-910]|nr:hypothetical protein L218DRAFT_986033 [Marasmius fiardii PR-910]